MFDYLKATLVNGKIQKPKRFRQLHSSHFEFLWLQSAKRTSRSKDRLFMWKRQQMDNQTSAGHITALEHSVFICLPPSVFLSGISGFIYPCRPPFFSVVLLWLSFNCVFLCSHPSPPTSVSECARLSVCSHCRVRETQTQHVGTDPSGKWQHRTTEKARWLPVSVGSRCYLHVWIFYSRTG